MTKASPLKLVNTRKLRHVDERGAWTPGGKQAPLYLDPRGEPRFVLHVQPYISTALGKAAHVEASTAAAAVSAYEALQSDYYTWIKEANAEPVLCVSCTYRGRDSRGVCIERNHSFPDHASERKVVVGLSYERAFRVNGKIHKREEYTVHDGEWPNFKQRREVKVGYPYGGRGVILPYSEALHARLDLLCNTINLAAQALHEIATSGDPFALLMSPALLAIAPPRDDALPGESEPQPRAVKARRKS